MKATDFRFIADGNGLEMCLSALREDPSAVLLVPTETVYGLVCSSESPCAIERIYDMKRRPKSKLLTLFVHDVEAFETHFGSIPKTAEIFAQKFCPGPITIVVPGQDGASTVGFRIPDHPFLLNLLKQFGKALASTSANLSGTPAALSVDQALESLAIPPAIAIDGGDIPKSSQASTVVQVLSDNSWKILREGPVSEQDLRSALT